MRKFILLIAAITLAGTAVASTSVDYNRATATVTTAEASFGEEVNFTMPASALTLTDKFLIPGAEYTVTIPVTNTTNRAIKVKLLEIVKSGSYTGTLATVTTETPIIDLAAGADANIVFTVKLDAGTTVLANANKTLILTFNFEGVSDHAAD